MSKKAQHINTNQEGITKEVLGKLISWIAQSSNSPISLQEASDLLDELYGTKKKSKKRGV